MKNFHNSCPLSNSSFKLSHSIEFSVDIFYARTYHFIDARSLSTEAGNLNLFLLACVGIEISN